VNEFLTAAWVAGFEAACADDPELRAIGAGARFSMLLRSGDRRCLVAFEDRLLRSGTELSIDDSWDFALEAPAADWEAFLGRLPPRHHHDLLAMWMRVPGFRIDGDRRLFMASLRVVRRLMELAREVASGASAREPALPQPGDGLEPIVGRYLWLSFEGRRYRVYYEEAGAGPPLLLLHTAGADSRQFAHMLNDPDYTARWRLVAFDLPRHGRSMPPDGW